MVEDNSIWFSCTQFPMANLDMFGHSESQEDCLILNVFVPILPPEQSSKLLPVMIFIHGGYFMIGSGLDYSGEVFMDENIVLVTINYRLGAFGFLTTGDGAVEGNLGLKDQVLALKWVQKNIQYFGGDPNRVTIFGESAGAGSVSHLVLSPMAKGLFHHAIAQSGSTLCPWAYQSRPVQIFQQFVTQLNCTADTTQKSVNCLKNKPVDEIVSACAETRFFIELKYPFFPSIETVPPSKSEIFLPDHPLRMLETGFFNHAPFIIGINEDEGAYQGGFLVRDSGLLADLNHHWISKAPIALGLDTRNISIANLNKGLRKLRRFNFGDDDIDQQHLYDATHMFSDSWFGSSLVHTIKYHSQHAPVYPYLFTKKGGLRLADMTGCLTDQVLTSHGDDLPYIFYKGTFTTIADKKFSKSFIKLWVSFAYTGLTPKPSHTWGSAKVWPKVEKGSQDVKYYQIDDDTTLISEPFQDRMNLWRDLVKNEWNEFRPYEFVEPKKLNEHD